MEPQIDFRIQGISHATVEREEDNRTQLIGRLAQHVMYHPNKDALIADLQCNRPYHLLSEESKKMTHEFFELCEIFPKMQCPYCLKYWTEGIVCCTCGTYLVPTEFTRKLKKWKIRRIDNP